MSLSSRAASLLVLSLLLPLSPSPAKAADGSPGLAGLPPSNPFSQASTLPFQAPPFDRIKDGDFQPAIEAAMWSHDGEIAAIADNREAPTFDNTIGALERSGQSLADVALLFHNLVDSNSNDTLNKANAAEAPRLQAHSDKIRLNGKLFARVRTLYEQRDRLGLDDKQLFLLTRTYSDFIRAGAGLAAKDQKKLQAINGKIAKLSNSYPNRLRNASNAAALVVDGKAELDGLSDAEIAAAAEAAKDRKLPGKYLLVLSNTTQQPLLASLKNRALRQKLLAASESRGSQAGPNDLRGLIVTLAGLRAERARLSGFPNYAAFKLDEQMAKTPEAAAKLLDAIVPAATAMARREAGEIQEVIDAEKGGFTVTAADWALYAAKVQKAKYDVDDAETRQYFELDRVLKDGVFFAANQLYGLTFKERTDLPVYQPDVRVYEVFDADGSHLALFYADYFARPNKNGGAWCNTLTQASGLRNSKPIVVNVANFTKPAAGEPALLSYDDVVTIFHEFGHAIHAMVSTQYYPSENGFNVPTDVIEFPSQFNEHWALYPSVLANYAKHYKTGQAMPQDLVEKIKRAQKYGTGYATTEIVSAALLDLEWHTLPADAPRPSVEAFEAAALKKNGVDLVEVPPRYKTPLFPAYLGQWL